MKIALIQPAFLARPPLGLLSIWAGLDSRHEVCLIDLNLDADRSLMDDKYDLAAITCTSFHKDEAIKLAGIVKKNGARVVAGGIHPTLDPSSMLNCPDIDFVIRGAGDKAFPELVEALDQGTPLDAVEGLCRKVKGEEYIAEINVIEDLDVLPLPMYRNYDMNKYEGNAGRYVHYETSRGCIHNCRYCSLWKTTGGKLYYKSRSKVYDDLLKIFTMKKKADRVQFMDNYVNFTKKRLSDICDIMTELSDRLKRPVEWTGLFKLKNFDEQLAARMRSSNAVRVGVGFESANQKSLDYLRRQDNVEENIAMIDTLIASGLYVVPCFQLGFPWETEKEMWNTVELAVEMFRKGAWAMMFTYMPLPGTDIEYDKGPGVLASNVMYSVTGDLGFSHPTVSNEKIQEMISSFQDRRDKIRGLK